MDITKFKPIIKRIVGKKYTRPILSGCLSDGIDLSFTDLETYVTLKDVNLPSGLLNLDHLGITNRVSELDMSDYPLFPEVQKGNSIDVSINHLEMLMDSVSNDETRLYLNGIAWVGTDLVSINGSIMTLIELQTNNTKDSSILPRTCVKELINLAKKFKLSEVNIQVDESFFKVDNEYFTLIGRLYTREFPKYRTILPVKTSHKMIVNTLPLFKDIKSILNKNNGIRLDNEEGKVSLNTIGSDFKVEIGNSDFKTPIGFNMKYLSFLVELDNNLMFNNELAPVKVVKENITRIAMPLKV